MPRPDPAVDICVARPEDRDVLVTLLAAQLEEHRIETPHAQLAETVEALLHRPRRARLLVARLEGAAVGVAALSFVRPIEHGGRSAWLEELYVTPAHRGRGIGRALLRAACGEAARGGACAVDLEVQADHERAAELYAREGFRPLERRRWVLRLAPAIAAAPAPAAGVTGGCFCGAVRYRTSARPRAVVHCHCRTCRRTSGAPMVTWATFAAADFAFTAGAPVELRSSAQATRTFCGACGTALTWRARPGWVDVTVGSMDDPDAVAPQAHVWTSSAVAWLHVDDELLRHAAEGPETA